MLIATIAAACGAILRHVRRCATGNRAASRKTIGVIGTHMYHSASGGTIYPHDNTWPPLRSTATWSLSAVYHAGSDQRAMRVRVRTL